MWLQLCLLKIILYFFAATPTLFTNPIILTLNFERIFFSSFFLKLGSGVFLQRTNKPKLSWWIKLSLSVQTNFQIKLKKKNFYLNFPPNEFVFFRSSSLCENEFQSKSLIRSFNNFSNIWKKSFQTRLFSATRRPWNICISNKGVVCS